MPLILAIEPDRRQAAQLSVIVRKRVQAELILVDTTERALDAIGTRMPDLVLVPALLSPQDDAALATALKVIAAAAHVQMLTIPVLGTARSAPSSGGGMLSVLRRAKAKAAAEPDGCDPAVFAEQIASYLEHVDQERPRAEVGIGGVTPHVEDAVRVDPTASRDLEDEPVEDAFSRDSVDSSLIDFSEPVAAASPVVRALDDADDPLSEASDESVSFALQEIARALFADLMPAPATAPAPEPEPVEVAPTEPALEAEPEVVAEELSPSLGAADEEWAADADTATGVEPVEPVEEPVVVAVVEQDEWVGVDQLLAALQLMPLAAIEATDPGEWIAPPASKSATRVERVEKAERPERIEKVEKPASTSEKREKGHQQPPLAASPSSGKSEREWVALIESLRHDVERLRGERDKPSGRKPAAVAAVTPHPEKKSKPPQDEWGFFDPEQCGFAALLAKLEEVTEDDGRLTH